MGILSWITGDSEEDIIVTTGRSKGAGKPVTNITVGDIRKRRVVDENGFENKVVIFSGGTGNPFFTTDTAAALRASEIDADIMIKATKVNGIYSDDPIKNPNAMKFDQISFDDVIDKKLKVMDATAFTLCREQSMPIGVINIFKQNSLYNFINENFSDGTLVTN